MALRPHERIGIELPANLAAVVAEGRKLGWHRETITCAFVVLERVPFDLPYETWRSFLGQINEAILAWEKQHQLPFSRGAHLPQISRETLKKLADTIPETTGVPYQSGVRPVPFPEEAPRPTWQPGGVDETSVIGIDVTDVLYAADLFPEGDDGT